MRAVRASFAGSARLPQGPTEALLPYAWRDGGGVSRARWVRRHPDADVAALIDSERTAQVVQTIGRGRAALRSEEDVPLRVFLFAGHPIPGLPVHRLTTIRELEREFAVPTDGSAESAAADEAVGEPKVPIHVGADPEEVIVEPLQDQRIALPPPIQVRSDLRITVADCPRTGGGSASPGPARRSAHPPMYRWFSAAAALLVAALLAPVFRGSSPPAVPQGAQVGTRESRAAAFSPSVALTQTEVISTRTADSTRGPSPSRFSARTALERLRIASEVRSGPQGRGVARGPPRRGPLAVPARCASPVALDLEIVQNEAHVESLSPRSPCRGGRSRTRPGGS